MKNFMLVAAAAAMIAGSATAAVADGMGDDFYAIQRSEPYAGAAPLNHATPAPEAGRRVFLNGYVVHHPHRHQLKKIEN
jgi:hypothetical protein